MNAMRDYSLITPSRDPPHRVGGQLLLLLLLFLFLIMFLFTVSVSDSEAEHKKGSGQKSSAPLWSERGDLNSRPHGPEPCALPTALLPETA